MEHISLKNPRLVLLNIHSYALDRCAKRFSRFFRSHTAEVIVHLVSSPLYEPQFLPSFLSASMFNWSCVFVTFPALSAGCTFFGLKFAFFISHRIAVLSIVRFPQTWAFFFSFTCHYESFRKASCLWSIL